MYVLLATLAAPLVFKSCHTSVIIVGAELVGDSVVQGSFGFAEFGGTSKIRGFLCSH